MELSKKICGEL